MITTNPLTCAVIRTNDSVRFFQFIKEARDEGKQQEIISGIINTKLSRWYGAFLSDYSAEDYNKMKLFLLDDDSAGMAIKESGEIVSVFKNTMRCKTKDITDVLIPQAISEGGRFLDCFNGMLVGKYAKYGFWPVSKMKFDPTFAPKEWN